MRELRNLAVLRCCLPGARLGLLLSGGFDSASILGSLLQKPSAAEELVCATAGYHCSGVADERALAGDLRRRLGIRGVDIDARLHLPTLREFIDQAAPCGNPFRGLNDALYAALAEAGAQCVLTGQFADELDAPGMAWLQEWRSSALRACLPLTDLLRSLPDLLALVMRRVLKQTASKTDAADALLPEWRLHLAATRTGMSARYRHWPRPDQVAAVLGAGCRNSESLEVRHYERHGLLPRHPFRDWELVRFMLSLPAGQTAVMGRTKLIQRRAAPQGLPSQVVSRRKCGTLAPLLLEAMKLAQAEIRSILTEVPVWRAYLRPDALDCLQLRDVRDLDRLCRMLGHVLWAAPEALRMAGAVAGRHR